MANSNDALQSLPIDQFSRQQWVNETINLFRTDSKAFKILDVGGYKGKTTEFQSRDIVTVCDLYDVKEPGYVKGDGRKLPFEDNSFDFVVTFDTFEHVPGKDRKKFIDELTRVSRDSVILTAPFDNDQLTVSKAEVSLNHYHRELYQKDHQWLKEHIDYKIPKSIELDKIVKDLGFLEFNYGSNRLDFWILMQTLYFSVELDLEFRERLDEVNSFYNKNLQHLDLSENNFSYRRIYFISKDEVSINKVKKFISDCREDAPNTKTQLQFLSIALARFGIKYRDVIGHDSYLDAEVKKLLAINKDLQDRVEKLEAKNYKGKIKKIAKKISRKN